MKYHCTRSQTLCSFEDAILKGFSECGGIFVPETIPRLSQEQLVKFADLSFLELCFEICSLFISREEISSTELKNIISQSFSIFEDQEIVKLQDFGELEILELFHGPTFAFKDIGLQFLGNLLNFLLQRRKQRASILVATSGDTGSAAIYATMNKPSLECFVLYPKGRISEFQEKQMTSINAPNIHVYGVDGSDSDALDLNIKEISSDTNFCSKYQITYMNSFNWARVMIQSVHYFYAYFAHMKSGKKTSVGFVVPTGAMGNYVACYLSYLMGLPISPLIAATNSNDIIHRFFQKREFTKKEISMTISPSMDIQQPYNFERLLYFLCQDTSKVKTIYEHYEKTGEMKIEEAILTNGLEIIKTFATSEDQTLDVMKRFHQHHNYFIDPHTGVGVYAAEQFLKEDSKKELTLICVATAHPCKFSSAVLNATGFPTPLPESAKSLLSIPSSSTFQANIYSNETTQRVKDDIAKYF